VRSANRDILAAGNTAAGAGPGRDARRVAEDTDALPRHATLPVSGTGEAEARRRARQLALVLMAASIVAVLTVLGGVWLLVRVPSLS
jgi:hypothetical protein